MKAYTVTIREVDGRRWKLSVLAASSVDACILALDAIGRLANVGTNPVQRAA